MAEGKACKSEQIIDLPDIQCPGRKKLDAWGAAQYALSIGELAEGVKGDFHRIKMVALERKTNKPDKTKT